MKKDNQHSKKLRDIEKKEMFRAPEGYFDQFPDMVFARIATEQKQMTSSKVFSLNRWWLAAAASIVIVVSLYLTFSVKESETKDYYAILNEVSSEEIAAYLGETDISVAELEMALASGEQINLYDSNSIPELEEEEDAEALLEYYSL